MAGGKSPWWMKMVTGTPLRRVLQPPQALLSQQVKTGRMVADVGCGRGYFSLTMAQMVGPAGRVVCFDLEKKYLDTLDRKARLMRVNQNISTRLCQPESLKGENLYGLMDFVLMFWVIHESSEPETMFQQAHRLLRRTGKILLAEPWHVAHGEFEGNLKRAEENGFLITARPKIALSRAAVLHKA